MCPLLKAYKSNRDIQPLPRAGERLRHTLRLSTRTPVCIANCRLLALKTSLQSLNLPLEGVQFYVQNVLKLAYTSIFQVKNFPGEGRGKGVGVGKEMGRGRGGEGRLGGLGPSNIFL